MNKYKVNKGYIAQKSGNKITIFDPEKSVIYSFNETAALILQKLQVGWGEDKILDMIITKFSVTHSQARKDLDEILSAMKENHIIEMSL